MRIVALFFAISLLVSACSKKGYEKIRFEDFKFDTFQLTHSTPVTVIQFSSGPDCTTEITYYYQFICVVDSTGDTIRVLSPCQTFLEQPQTNHGTLDPLLGSGLNTPAAFISRMLKTASKEKESYIIFNKELKDLEERNYKTIVGTIGF